MLFKKILWVWPLLISTLAGSVNFPQVYTVFEKTDDDERIYKMILSKNQKHLLVMRHHSVSIVDAKSFKEVNKISFKGSAWDCAFAEKGFVLLTHHDFTYYDATGTNRLYYVERRDGGQISKMDMRKNGYIVNLIKDTGRIIKNGTFDQRGKGLFSLNLRTKEYKETIYKSDFKEKHYLNDIRDNILQISTGNHTYNYINILTGKKENSFHGENILPNGRQVIDLKTLALEDIGKKGVIHSYAKPAGRMRFGCMAPSGKRFAVLTADKPVYVFDIDKREPIFSLPRNLNTSKTRDCLLYGDTLILWGKSMQVYSLKDAKKINSAVSPSMNVMPIIGSCTDASYGVGLWVNTMYGWDMKKGKMLWYSKGPNMNRNHWENASYLIKMQSEKKVAFVQPFGERAFGKELKVNLEDGSFIEWSEKKREKSVGKAVVCDPGLGEYGELWLEKEFSFSRNGVSFYALNGGEWLAISEKDGYFNASSENAISLLHKDSNALSEEDIKKWYRPDIIEAKLAEKSIEGIKNKNVKFTLPIASDLHNRYRQSLIRQITEDQDYKKLSKILYTANESEFIDIKNAIEQVNSTEGYFAFYRALAKRKFDKDEAFIEERVKHIENNSKEKPELIRYLARMNKNELIDQIESRQGLQDGSKKAIASVDNDLVYSETVMWDVWENQHFIHDKRRLEFLNQNNPDKAQELAVKSLIYILKNLEQNCSATNRWSFDNICQSELSRQRDGSASEQIKMLFEFLTTNNIKVAPEELKELAFQELSRFTSGATYIFYEEERVLSEFYMKYATKIEKQKLVSLNRAFLEKAIFQANWNSPSWGETKLSRLRIMITSMVKTMKPFDPEYIQNIERRIITSDNMKMREALVGAIVDFKDEDTADAVVKNVLQREKNSGFVDNSYINRLLDTKDKKILFMTIDMFNQFDDCNKIRDWYRYKLKKVLSSEEYKRFKCEPFKNEMVPYGRDAYKH